MIITIDGPAGAGKSTVARLVARELNLPYLNSGLIYRSVTLLVLEQGGRFGDRSHVEQVIRGLDLRFEESGPGAGEAGASGKVCALETRVFIGDREVSSELVKPEVTSEVHRVANDGGYRALLVDFQRRCAESAGVVAEGRDMGTVIFPGADLKVYLDASAEERARRRHRESLERGDSRAVETSFEEVLSSMRIRDRHDREREHAPLRVPEGGVRISTDGLTAEQVAAEILALARSEGV